MLILSSPKIPQGAKCANTLNLYTTIIECLLVDLILQRKRMLWKAFWSEAKYSMYDQYKISLFRIFYFIEAKHSRMYQVIFVEDSRQKIWNNMVWFLNTCLLQVLLGPFYITLYELSQKWQNLEHGTKLSINEMFQSTNQLMKGEPSVCILFLSLKRLQIF